jgi:hypothetical protein
MGRIKVQDQHWQRVPETPISKIPRAKWTGGVDQAIEGLLCKLESKFKPQSSPPPPTHTQKRKKPQGL